MSVRPTTGILPREHGCPTSARTRCRPHFIRVGREGCLWSGSSVAVAILTSLSLLQNQPFLSLMLLNVCFFRTSLSLPLTFSLGAGVSPGLRCVTNWVWKLCSYLSSPQISLCSLFSSHFQRHLLALSSGRRLGLIQNISHFLLGMELMYALLGESGGQENVSSPRRRCSLDSS